MIDALQNPIKLGETYGYTQSSNGNISIVKGKAFSTEGLRTTLENVSERSGAYGEPGDFTPQARKRSVYSCCLFPINEKI